MTPIKQTKLHSESQRGNCFAAAIASVLDMPLHAIPKFEECKKEGEWQKVLFDWLYLIGWDVEIDYKKAPKGFSIAGGTSIRGIKHAVVVKDGEFIHDPHPSNDFIETVDEYWVFKKET